MSKHQLLVQNAHNDQWREVIILASGHATLQVREKLLQDLIERGDKDKHRYLLHLLAISCLETSIELGPSVKVELENRLIQLVPPKNMMDAQALASAGDLAVPYCKFGNSMGRICEFCRPKMSHFAVKRLRF